MTSTGREGGRKGATKGKKEGRRKGVREGGSEGEERRGGGYMYSTRTVLSVCVQYMYSVHYM